MNTIDKTNNQLNRESWILAAFETLYLDGIDAVRIEPLAVKLNVTKGSFYWHFKTVLNSMMPYWIIGKRK